MLETPVKSLVETKVSENSKNRDNQQGSLKTREIKMEWNWKKDITKEKLIDLYVNQKKSMRDLASIFRCERNTIRRHLKKHSIAINYDRRDCLMTKYWTPLPLQDNYIVGMMMGDASVLPMNGCQSCRLSFSHCIAQKDYFLWKVSLLSPIFSVNAIKQYTYLRDNGTTTSSIVGHTYASLYFRKLRKMFYDKDGKKIINQSILSRITPAGLAVWFMDDGCCKKLGIELATCCFSYEEHIVLRKWFMIKFGLRPIIRKSGKHFVLFFNKTNALAFLEIVNPYIHPSMIYKTQIFMTPQRLHARILCEEKMIQSELHGDMQRQAEMPCPSMI